MNHNSKHRTCPRCGSEFEPPRPSLVHCQRCQAALYGRITEEALYDPRLTPEDRLVLIECDRRGWWHCTPSAPAVASRLNLNVKTVRKSFRSLEQFGYIALGKRDGSTNVVSYMRPQFWSAPPDGIPTDGNRRTYSIPTARVGSTLDPTHAEGTPPYPSDGYPPTHAAGTPLPTGRVPKQSHTRPNPEPPNQTAQGGGQPNEYQTGQDDFDWSEAVRRPYVPQDSDER